MNWNELALGDIAEITSSKRIYLSDYVPTGIPFYRSKEIIQLYNNKNISLELFINKDKYGAIKSKFGVPKKNDILITAVGTLGIPYLVKEGDEFYFKDGNLIWLRKFTKGVNSKFIYLWMGSKFGKKRILSYSIGVAQPALTIVNLKKVNIPLPSFDIQNRIVSLVSAYDDLIETNNQRIATLEQLAQQIYKEWFVRMRFPGWENTAFEHGIPEGWEIENFDKFCMLQRGFDLPDQEIKNGIYPVMASTSIKAFHNTYKVEPPVITTGRSGSLGTVLFSHQKAWPLNTALFVKNFYGNSPYLVFYTLKILKLESFNAGAGVPSLNRNHLRGIKIKVPSKEIQNQFDKIISDIFNQKVVLEESNSILEKTRNLLLPRLISGKLSIKQAEAFTP